MLTIISKCDNIITKKGENKMGFLKGIKDRMKAIDTLTEKVNNGEIELDRKNLEIKKKENQGKEKKQED